MATFETVNLATQVCAWVSNVRSNIRGNAAAYKAALLAGRTPAQVAAVANADAAQYIQTLNGLQVYADDPTRRARLLDALAVFSIDQAAVAAEFGALRSAAVGQQNAAKTTANQINNMADAILAGLPSHDLPSRTGG